MHAPNRPFAIWPVSLARSGTACRAPTARLLRRRNPSDLGLSIESHLPHARRHAEAYPTETQCSRRFRASLHIADGGAGAG